MDRGGRFIIGVSPIRVDIKACNEKKGDVEEIPRERKKIIGVRLCFLFGKAKRGGGMGRIGGFRGRDFQSWNLMGLGALQKKGVRGERGGDVNIIGPQRRTSGESSSKD